MVSCYLTQRNGYKLGLRLSLRLTNLDTKVRTSLRTTIANAIYANHKVPRRRYRTGNNVQGTNKNLRNFITGVKPFCVTSNIFYIGCRIKKKLENVPSSTTKGIDPNNDVQ
jgi:hypothetical protein